MNIEELTRRAAEADLEFRQISPKHWRLKHKEYGWWLDLYPENHRIVPNHKKRRAPFLAGLPKKWTLEDIINSALRGIHMRKREL